MHSTENLANHLVDKLFELGGDVSFGKVYRIQFMTGEFLNEQGSGGMAREPLIRLFTRILEEYQPQEK